MSAFITEEIELTEKHEEMFLLDTAAFSTVDDDVSLGRRAELLEQMESRREQLKVQRKQQAEESEAARQRNNTLLQDLQKIEDRLRGRQLPCPDLLALETRYCASVEESIPAWEHFLLGKGPHPTDGPGQPPRRAKQKPSTAKDWGLPPRPKPRAAR